MEKLARKLRRSATEAEVALWLQLKNRNLGGFKFRRQHPIPPYIVDFVCLERKLVVELDGGQHVEQASRDSKRTLDLNFQGFQIVRFWNDEVFLQTNAVLEEILRRLNSPHPRPSPRKRSEGSA